MVVDYHVHKRIDHLFRHAFVDGKLRIGICNWVKCIERAFNNKFVYYFLVMALSRFTSIEVKTSFHSLMVRQHCIANKMLDLARSYANWIGISFAVHLLLSFWGS